MWRLFCDGCYAAEPRVFKDLTDRQNSAITVSPTPDQVLHLCPERCAEIWWTHSADMKTIQRETMGAYYKQANVLLASLWELFRNAEKEISSSEGEQTSTGDRDGDRGKPGSADLALEDSSGR